jgi:thioesterase DpgC
VLRGGVVNHPKYVGRRVFSAGINLKHLHAGQISFVEFLLEREAGFISKIYQGLLQDDGRGRLQCLSKPWLAAVDGFAIGGGAQLLLVFDCVIAAEGSYFCLPAAKEGIVPGVANLRLSRYVGAKLARRIILHGRVVHAHDPEASLLVDEVVKPEHMDRAITSAVRELDNPAVVANRTILNHAEEPMAIFRAYMAEFVLQQSERAYSEDVQAKVARHARKHASPVPEGQPAPANPANAAPVESAGLLAHTAMGTHA